MAPEDLNVTCRGQDPQIVFLYGDGAELAEWGQALERAGRAASGVSIFVPRSSFFGPNFLEQPDLPEPAGVLAEAAKKTHFARHYRRTGPKTAALNFDVIASAFWFLTRYEEYVVSPPEAHDRFLASFSIAPPEMYDEPVVNRWFERLYELCSELQGVPADPPVVVKPRLVLTHDVDLMRKYRGLMGVRRTIAAMMRGDAQEATHEIRTASLVLAGLRRDPYDSFDEMFSMKERLGAPSTFFLMGGGRAPLDADYSLQDQHVRELILRIVSAGDEIGLHPSYESYRSAEMIRHEMQALEEAIGHRVIGSRQHYLRFALPDTWYALAECGFRYDTTLGFADRAGFRCGWSGCFRPFDVEKRIELPIIELPLVIMDVSLAVYEKIPSEAAVERLARLLDASETAGGACVVLWHNTLHDRRTYPGYWETMEYFLFASAGTAEFTTAGKLCEEFELRMVQTG